MGTVYSKYFSLKKDCDISCARFWSIVVSNARDHFKVPIMDDAHMVNFVVLNTSTFTSLNSKDFHYVGAISELMLKEVLAKNKVITIYRKIPKPGSRSMSHSMQVGLESTVSPKQTGGKRKRKLFKKVFPKRLLKKKK